MYAVSSPFVHALLNAGVKESEVAGLVSLSLFADHLFMCALLLMFICHPKAYYCVRIFEEINVYLLCQ